MHTNCTKYIIFYAHHSCKEKKNQLSKGIGQFRARSGPIRSDPVIRPDPVNTRTPTNGALCYLTSQHWPDTLRVAVKASSYSEAVCVSFIPVVPFTTTLFLNVFDILNK